jgi:glyoxylase-like metal-dependent hydrolase (beta-lactamase superfamily II)
MKEIVPGIRTWSVYSTEKGMNFNGWHVRGAGGEAVVIDPPKPDDEVLQEIARAGRPAAVILTNKHHTRATETMRATFGCPVCVHENERELMEIPVDRTYRDGDVLACGLKVFTVSHSKTPGESALLFDGSVRALIVGDAILGKPPGSLSLLSAPMIRDARRAIDGLRRLAAVDFEALLLGDGEPILRDGRAALLQFIERAGRE